MDDDTLRARAAERLARVELNRIEERRDVALLLRAGRSPDDIARLVRTDLTHVAQIESTIDGCDPPTEAVAELILRAVVLHTDRQELIEHLQSIHYTVGEHPPTPYEGTTSGTWDEIVDAFFEGWLTQAEFESVRASRAIRLRLEDPPDVTDTTLGQFPLQSDWIQSSLARSNARLEVEIAREFGLLNDLDVERLMSPGPPASTSLATEARRAGRLLGLRRGGAVLFPGFQFGEDGQPLAVIADLRAIADEVGCSEVDTIYWLCTATTYFADASRPVDHLRSEPEKVLDTARAAWTVEW